MIVSFLALANLHALDFVIIDVIFAIVAGYASLSAFPRPKNGESKIIWLPAGNRAACIGGLAKSPLKSWMFPCLVESAKS